MDSISGNTNPAFQYGNHAVCTVPARRHAITVRHAKIQYKDVLSAIFSAGAPSINVILKDFNMSIEKGHIYGLLGASGCGKTSLLRAIVGQHNLTAGEIRVLGHRPTTPESGIPGTTVGYMPQELCLLEEFTIKESLYFYGKLGGMSSDEIDAKCDYFVKFLELPKPNRIVGTLSGGQQRRVSFAIALLHSPPVLILDEPTVGVDPLLRERSVGFYLSEIFANLSLAPKRNILNFGDWLETSQPTVLAMQHLKPEFSVEKSQLGGVDRINLTGKVFWKRLKSIFI